MPATSPGALKEKHPVEQSRQDDIWECGCSIELSRRDVRQYGSIAYALRAILAVEQDNLLNLSAPFLPTEPAAIDVLKEAFSPRKVVVKEQLRGKEIQRWNGGSRRHSMKASASA